MALSSPGIGSGLDVNGIVSKLVSIEKQPLTGLKTKASTLQSQLSLYGTVKSQVSSLADAAAALARPDGWALYKATSSNETALTVTAGATATPAAFSMEVTQLARAQTTVSMSVANKDATLGVAGQKGFLTFEVGNWSDTSTFVRKGTRVEVNGDDTLTVIAGKINASDVGVSATVLRAADGSEKLIFQAKATGVDAGFRIYAGDSLVPDPDPLYRNDAPETFTELNALSITSLPGEGTVGTGSSLGLGQSARNAMAKLNGVSVEAATNTLTGSVPGLTIQLKQLTAAPVDVTVAQDQEAIKAKIQTFADAYTALNKTLADATKYVSGGASGPLQGDATAVGLQRLLSNIMSSSSVGSTYTRLTEIGLERQKDGSLKLDSSKLTSAMSDMANLQKLFVTDNGDPSTNGFGLKLRDFARGLIAADGTVSNRSTALQGSISRNSREQDRVNERAARVEKQLLLQYSSLDARLAGMQSLGSYVSAQLAQWNKSG